MLIEQARRHSLDVWHAYGRCFEAMLLLRQGAFDLGLPRLRAAAGDLRRAGFTQYHTPYLAALAEGLGGAGQITAGLAVINEGIERIENTKERWCLAELRRIKGELIMSKDTAGAAAAAEECFLQALDLARRQHTLSWALRTATSLARLWRAQCRLAEARELLKSTYDRFTEGFATTNLVRAKALLEQLA